MLPIELYGKRSIDYSAQGDPYNILPSLESRYLWDATVPYTAVRGPIRFVPIPGEPGRHAFRDAHTSVSIVNETFEGFYRERNVRRVVRTRVLDDAKSEGVPIVSTGLQG